VTVRVRTSALRRVTVATAGALLVAGAWPARGAEAQGPAFDYSSVATAVGVQTRLAATPEPTPVPDLTDVEVPASDAQLDSFGTSDATGHVGNTNGLGQLPGLLCEAGVPCDQVSAGSGGAVGFPPPDPLAAHASYPTPADATAPTVGGQAGQVSGGAPGALIVTGGTAAAAARPTSTSATATGAVTDVAGVVTVGSAHTTEHQAVDGSGLRTTATAVLGDVSIGTGGLLHAGSVTVTTTTTSTLGHPGTDTSSATVSDATVAGQPAVVDASGVHVQGGALPAPVQAALQSALDTALGAAGVTVSLGGVARGDDTRGHSVIATGLTITRAATVAGAPPVSVGLPPGVPCPTTAVPGDPLSALPVEPCSGVGLDPNAAYVGSVVLGSVGVTSNVVTDDLQDLPALPALPGGPLPAAALSPPPAAPAATTAAAVSRTTPPALPAVAGAATPAAAVGAAPSGAAGPPAAAPAAASALPPPGPLRATATDDPLAGVAGRLPLLAAGLALGAVALLGGRLRRAPARLPRGTA